MIRGTDISLSFGTEVIYEDASFLIEPKHKVGIVGVNGAGKTTLFRLILGELEPDHGDLYVSTKKIGYLPQEIALPDLEISVLDYIAKGRPINELEEELNKTYEELANVEDTNNTLLKKAQRIQLELDYLNQYGAEDELLELVESMSFDYEMLNRPLSTLSGGQKSKVAFARLLYAKPQVLLLDEPTNHLDVTTKKFVIDYINKFTGSVLVISHDIDFLNAIIDRILFVDKVSHKFKIYKGDYRNFKRLYAEEMMAKEARIEQQEREIAKLEAIVKMAKDATVLNFKLKRMGHSKEKALNKKKEQLEVRDKVYAHVKMKIDPTKESGKVPMSIEGLSFAYPGAKNLYTNLSFNLQRNERFLIVGENGIGKSTLLKLIMRKLTPSSGNISFSQKTTISYYAQELEILDESKSIIQNVDKLGFTERELRGYLSNFLFHGDDIYKEVSKLSPGEKARLALCKILLEKSNTIILDEPTNHFDPDTQKIIGENFKDFNGTLIVVSHNPSFVEQIGITRMLTLPDGKILNYSHELLQYYYYVNTDF